MLTSTHKAKPQRPPASASRHNLAGRGNTQQTLQQYPHADENERARLNTTLNGTVDRGFDFSRLPILPAQPAPRSPQSQSGTRPLAFPHATAITAGLGRTTPLRSVLDAPGCAQRGTPAFTVGDTTHFASATPSLRVAAHEAAHQFQHAGLSRDLFLGAEGHANAIANAIVSGCAHPGLLAQRGNVVPPRERGYSMAYEEKPGKWRVWRKESAASDPNYPLPKGDSRLSDIGSSLTFSTQEAWAAASLITASNIQLANKTSSVHLAVGPATIEVEIPQGSGTKTLNKVLVKVDSETEVCDQMASGVMTGQTNKGGASAVARLGGTTTDVAPVSWKNSPFEAWVLLLLLNKKIKNTPGYANLSVDDKRALQQEVYADYEKNAPKDKDLWDYGRKLEAEQSKAGQLSASELGIDDYAIPEVGQAYATFRTRAHSGKEYPHHYAAVIMAPGNDRVTLENEADRKPDQWQIQTYGTMNPRDTFHSQHTAFADDAAHPQHTMRMEIQSQHPTLDQLNLTGPTSVDLNTEKPTFTVGNLPRGEVLLFRWIIADADNNSYLMYGDAGPVQQYGSQSSAYIGSGTRKLLKEKGIHEAYVLCRVRAADNVNRLMKFPVTFM
jgi:hypothetical protein